MADTVKVCRRTPLAGELIGGKCPECSHLTALHVGTVECPVCRFVELASPEGRAREARRMGVQWP